MSKASNLAGFVTSITPVNNLNVGVVTATSAVVGSGVTINAGGLNVTGVITATSFVGDGSGLTGAGSTVANDTTTNSTFYPVFTTQTSGTVTASKVSTSKLSFNPSSGTLSATAFSGDGSALTNLPSSAFSDSFIPEDTKTISSNLTVNNNQSNISFAEDLVIGAGVTFTVSTGTTVRMDAFNVINSSSVTATTVAATSDIDIPAGTVAQRYSTPTAGSFRYNSDYNALEVYTGTEWVQFIGVSVGGRGLFGGGNTPTPTPSVVNTIDYISISTLGNAQDFGDLTLIRNQLAACASYSRGVFGGGSTTFPTPAIVNTIDYITIASEGNAIDFGDLTQTRRYLAACSSNTRGVFGGGYTPGTVVNTIDYITIASVGNATDFGDLTVTRRELAACSSSTRGVFGGGYAPYNVIDYITIASVGDATDFGDLTVSRRAPAACSSSTRGVFGGGYYPGQQNVIDYITIASIGNATDFGDLTVSRRAPAACSSTTRGVFGGGYVPGTVYNVIDYITIASVGDATDFGDLTQIRSALAGCSNSHGGLS